MELTNDDCITVYNGLSEIVQPEFADIKDLPDREQYIYHIKFVYAVSYNKRILKDIVDSLQETSKAKKEYEDYLAERDKLLQRYSVKDDNGAPRERVEQLGAGLMRRSYIVPDLADPATTASKAIKKLEEKSKDIIDQREKQQEDFKKLLKEKPKKLDLKFVTWGMIPRGLQPQWMDAVMFMIDPDSKEPTESDK